MSRDLDKRLAVILKGGTTSVDSDEYGRDRFWWLPDGWADGDFKRGGDARPETLAAYSTDIAAAIGALEEYCNNMAWSAELRIGEEWRQCDITEPEGDIIATANAATLPLAICAAILSASDAGVGE